MKLLKKIITYILISIVFSIIFKVDFVKQNHFNLITVTTVLVGFLFTSLSILLTFLNEKVIQFLDKADSLDNIYKNIIEGIQLGISSVLVSLLNLILFDNIKLNFRIRQGIYSLELVLLIGTILCLFIAVIDTKNLIDCIRIDRKKQNDKKEANKIMEKKYK